MVNLIKMILLQILFIVITTTTTFHLFTIEILRSDIYSFNSIPLE